MEKNKIIAVAVVVVLVVVALVAAIAVMGNDSDNKGLNIIGRVNSEGSGIYIKESEDVATYVADAPADGVVQVGEVYLIKEGWGGKVFGDPGVATIQHVQLGQIAAALDLKFAPYTIGEETAVDTLYYFAGIATYNAFATNLENNPDLVGAFIWEAQLAIAEANNCKVVAITNNLFPGHACCIIGASQKYMDNNHDNTVRFLAAYIEAVNQLNAAIGTPGTDAYNNAMDIAKDYLSVSLAGLSDEEQEAAIAAAWSRVTYLYADDASGSLSDLTAEVAALAKDLYTYGNIQKTAEDVGFTSYSALADSFVDDSYMTEAAKLNLAGSETSTVKVTVAVISGDIHQFAIQYGMEMGIFDQFGVKITLSSQTAGPGVYTALANGDAQFGFLGVPPMTINSINNETIGDHNIHE